MPEDPVRPDDIRHDLAILIGDMEVAQKLIWLIIEDVVSSYRLATEQAFISAGLTDHTASALEDEIHDTVGDYLSTHWGDD